jgi:hypothetical protein
MARHISASDEGLRILPSESAASHFARSMIDVLSPAAM